MQSHVSEVAMLHHSKISSILTALVIASDADVFAELKTVGCGEEGARY